MNYNNLPKLWEPNINKTFNKDILTNIFEFCDPQLKNVCCKWKNILKENEYIWLIWYKKRWTNTIFTGNWKEIYLKMYKLDFNWFNSIYHKTSFYENSWIMNSKLLDNYILTASKWGIIKLWDTNNLKEHPKIYSGHLGPVSCIDFDINLRLIVSGSHDGTIRLWNFDNHHYTKMLTHHTDEIYSIKLDNNNIYSTSKDTTLKIYNINSENIITLSGHLNSVWNLTLDDKNNIYSCSLDGTVKFWEIDKNYECSITLNISNYSVLGLCYYNNYLFLGNWDGSIQVYFHHKLIYNLKLHQQFITSIKIINDKLITAGYDNQVKIFKVVYYPTFKLILKNIITSDKLTSIAVNNDSLLTTNTLGKINYFNFDI